MRLWSLHPKYLDSKGLVALWREALLAQKVLMQQTKGYKHHPQLERFKDRADPASAIAAYLMCICDEAEQRGYSFDRSKIRRKKCRVRITVTDRQLQFELLHLRKKLWQRDRRRFREISSLRKPIAHPIFNVIKGPIADWERA